MISTLIKEAPPSSVRNANACDLANVHATDFDGFRETILDAVDRGARVSALFARPAAQGNFRLYVVLAGGNGVALEMCSTEVAKRFPSLTPECAELHLFEREMAEQWGIHPEGHPGLAPVRYLRSPRASGNGHGAPKPAVMDFYRVEGDEIHEVAVGPVHAGVIEPGHFRFQCHGETVFHLEIALGFQHRGVERAILTAPAKRRLSLMETIAGDTTIGHTTAYCQVIEALGSTRPSIRAQTLRAIALELERLANHTGDLGALAGDVGYLPVASYCGRIRGDFLNASALLCGSRFGRGLVRPGGVRFDVDRARLQKLQSALDSAERDVLEATALLWNSPSVMARFTDTGRVKKGTARALGLVGVAARACGLKRDSRTEFPTSAYRETPVPMAVEDSGDVYARAHVRWREIQTSLEYIRQAIRYIPEDTVQAEVGPLMPGAIAVALVEGWRGEICHVGITGPDGTLAAYKVVDPSFHNWTGLSMALRNGEISDFPLCNKSFNLSYCGHDL